MMVEFGMTVTLLLLIAVVPVVAYGFWMAGELGVGPRWRRSRRPKVDLTDVEPKDDRARREAP
jgi:hypothetical protein